MVKKVLKFFIYLLFFKAMLIFFMPKENLYYLAEKELAKKSLVISKENIKDSGFIFNIENAHISMKEIQSAVISNIELKLFLFFNRLRVENIHISQSFKNFLPLNIDKVDISYSILDPLNIIIKADGGFGVLNGSFNLIDRALFVVLKPSKLMYLDYKTLLRNFKKNKDGEYIYVKNI